MKEFIKNLFVGNWQYKLLAIFASFALWYYVASGQTLTINITVPVQLDNFPANMKITNRMISSVELQLAGRRDIINNLTRNSLKVKIDMKKAVEGKNIYTINQKNIKGLIRGIEINNISPYQVEIVLEKTYGEKAEQ